MSWGGGGGGADDGAGRERRVDSAAVVASDIRASRCKAAFSISESGNARLLYWFRIAAARPGSGGLAEEEEEVVVDGRRPVAAAAVAADDDEQAESFRDRPWVQNVLWCRSQCEALEWISNRR